jgi:hypothetical protein
LPFPFCLCPVPPPVLWSCRVYRWFERSNALCMDGGGPSLLSRPKVGAFAELNRLWAVTAALLHGAASATDPKSFVGT